MKLTWANQLRVHSGEITFAQAIAEQATGAASGPTMAEQYAEAKAAAVADGPGWLAKLFEAHDELVEQRADWKECKKNARRKALVEQWHAYQDNREVAP